LNVDGTDDGDDGDQQPLPDVPYFGGANDWNLNAVNAPEAWAQGYTGAGVIVAVIDTGVDYYHSELAGSIWTNDDIAGNGIDDDGNGYIDDYHGWDFAYGDNNPLDVHGHGTHVAGTIAAAHNGIGANGVAFGALIMPVQVLDAEGSGTWEAVAAGIRFAVDNGAHIINLSLGGGYHTAIAGALAYANQMGVFVAAAAGNEAAAIPGYPAYHSGDFGNVLSVGAHNSSDTIAGFSNRVGNSGAVQIDAPGVGVFSCLPGNLYDSWNGTSLATPHVAGVAALVLESNPNLTPSQLRQMLVEGATRSIYGSDSAGGLNAAMSVALALNATPQTLAAATQPIPGAGSPAVNALSIRAVDRAFDMGIDDNRGGHGHSPSALREARLTSTPGASAEAALLGVVAAATDSNDAEDLRFTTIDAAFESLADEWKTKTLQLI
jgi:subtilisin family serine protease